MGHWGGMRSSPKGEASAKGSPQVEQLPSLGIGDWGLLFPLSLSSPSFPLPPVPVSSFSSLNNGLLAFYQVVALTT